MTFRELFQTGQCSINTIDEWVALWHRGGGLKMPLQTFLGLNADEYQVWLTRGNAGLANRLKEGHSPEYTLVYLGWDELEAQIQEIVDKELGDGFTVSLRRQDYYYWDIQIQSGQEMTEELSERICERLDLCDVDVYIFMDETWVDSNHLHRLLSKLTHREVTSSHADDNGVYIICNSLIWSSPEFTAKLLADCEARLRCELSSPHSSLVNPDTARHHLLGFLDALNTLGMLDEEKCRVAPDYFIGPQSPADSDADLAEQSIVQ